MKIVSVIFGLILIFGVKSTLGYELQEAYFIPADTLGYDGTFGSDNAPLRHLLPSKDSVLIEICYPAAKNSFASFPVRFELFHRSAPPVYTIDFLTRKTREAVSPVVEYTADTLMGNTVNGNSRAVELTPGQTLYFRTKAVDKIFSSRWFFLDVPSAPNVEQIAIDFQNEKLIHLPMGVLWKINGGTESPVRPDLSKLIPAEGAAEVSVHIYVPASDLRFASDVRRLAIPARPVVVLKDMKRKVEDPTFVPELQLSAEFQGSKILLTTSDESIARIDGERIIPVGVGKCAVTAVLEAGDDYFASLPVTASLEVTGSREENMPEVSVNDLVLADGHTGNTALKFEIAGTTGMRKLVVFNIAGKVVYQSEDYKNDYDMAKQHAGTYYYVLSCSIGNHHLVKKGFVEVVK